MATTDFVDREGRNEFHRAIALQYECVTDLLREFLDSKLSSNSISLKNYLGNCRVLLTGKKYVTQFQEEIFNCPDPDSKDFDVTTLTLILLAKCNTLINLTRKEKQCIEKLRDHRNTLAHNVSARLKDNKLFINTSNDIMDLSKSLNVSYQNNLKACIDELKQRACIRIHSKLEVLQFNTEQLQVILAYKEDHSEENDESLLKFNLSRWAKQISRGLDMNIVLSKCLKLKIISKEAHEQIKDAKFECDKAAILIDFLIKEGKQVDILHFCKLLRDVGKQCANLADLIEGNNTDGKKTVDEIQKIEEAKLTKILQSCIQIDEKGNETCEAVHSYVEEIHDSDISFTFLNIVMEKTFDCSEKYGRYEGIVLSKSTCADSKRKETLDGNLNIAAMSFEKYAEYIGGNFKSIGDSVCDCITEAIKKEVVQVELFVDLKEDELENLFGPYLHSKPLQFGVKAKLQRLQKAIRSQLNSPVVSMETKCLLREFDKPFPGKYHSGEVTYPLGGNQNNPAHEFIEIESSILSKYVIVKNTMRFFSACLNARKNGTIHFGVKRTGRNTGQVVGCDNKLLAQSVDDIVRNSIYRCFGHLSTTLQRNILRCIRSAQIITIEDDCLVVVEIDIVPFGKHLSHSFYTVMFPPNGPQTEIFFLYEEGPSCDIVVVEKDRIEATKKELDETLKERHLLDNETLHRYRSAFGLSSKLISQLTNGADYITDVFFPVICAGNMKTVDFLNYHGLLDAFQNSFAVFDFSSTTTLRKKMEEGKAIYTVKTASDFDIDEKDISFSDKEIPWIYCNGNDDIGIEVYDATTWTDRRMVPLENVLRYLKTKIPRHRAKIIFLAFEVYGCKDPMVMFAREVFIRIFKHQCIIIGETHEVLEPFENEISRLIGNEKVGEFLFFGLNWIDIAKVFRKTFKESSGAVCKIPNSSGTYDEVSNKEREKWKNISILSMEECINEVDEMKADERKIKHKEEETKFYQGKQASWWNFHYGHHGERDLFSKLRSSIENKLTRIDGKMLVESVEVRHEPGAGGSVLGRHLIWHFSQLRCISEPYRCCVVKQITENTVREIEEFRQYSDPKPKPVIILLDDEPDGNMYFQKGLQQLAYKTASPGELFGLVINVSRISLASDLVDEAEDGQIEVKNSLKHRLTEREKMWFEKKYKELENSDVDVSTLIAFNVMRNSFDKEYIRSTVDKIMNEVSAKEIDVLKVLSLVCTFEPGLLVPHSIFDPLIDIHVSTKQTKIGQGKPYGLRLRQKGAKRTQPPEILNSKSLSLFVCRSGYELKKRGLRVISQPLAEVILHHIKEKQNLSLEDIVTFIIDQMQNQCSNDSTDSKRFIEVVCSLFKTREDSGKGKDGIKDKFSRLIVALLGGHSMEEIESVVRVMDSCIDVSKDAFVGQQLARFHIIYKKDFEAAERAICDSIAMCPNNSYLLDTYGQVFKTNMEFLKEKNCQHGQKISNDIAKKVITLAFKALDKFEEGQVTTQTCEKERHNLSCYYMEVRTLVGLLEIFESFDCYTNDTNFIEVLNSADYGVDRTFLRVLNDDRCIDEIVTFGKRQVHAADSLRFVEETDYQVKKIYTIHTSEDVLLLTLRERYERFYRSHGPKYQLKFGYGLKPLLKAMKSNDQSLVRSRYLEAEKNLRSLRLEHADKRDLLFFIGYNFVKLLSSDKPINSVQYRNLLSYSAKLIDTQKDEKRPYLEAFLFYAIFHWPLKGRFTFENLSSPNTYHSIMDLWEKTYMKNNYITNREQMKANKGKTYFALSKDHFGVIDLFEIEMEWREMKEKEGRSRMHVYKDFFWREPFVAEQLERLTGTLDDTGNYISHVVEYPNGTHVFRIKPFYPSAQLRNRQVTFVLAFTWSGLRAFDVVEKCYNSSKNGPSENENRIQESDTAVNSDIKETYQRRQHQSNVDDGSARPTDTIHPRRNNVSQSDFFQPTSSDVLKSKMNQTVESKFQQAESNQMRTIDRRQQVSKTTEESHFYPSNHSAGRLTRKSGYKINELHRDSKKSKKEGDIGPPTLSDFPVLGDNTMGGLPNTCDRQSGQRDKLSRKEAQIQSSTGARPKQIKDYASVVSTGFIGKYEGKHFQETVQTFTQAKVDDSAPEAVSFDKEYWDQLQKDVRTGDLDTRGRKTPSYGLNEILLDSHQTDKTRMSVSEKIGPAFSETGNVEVVQSQSKKKKKKKKKKEKIREP